MKTILLKSFLFLCLIALLLSTAKAQLSIVKRPKLCVGANVMYSMPQSNFKEAFQHGVGGEVYGGVGLGSTYLLASLGITSYKPPSGFSNNLSIVPISLGLKKYFLLRRIFINGDVGVAKISYKGTNTSAFTTGLGAGVRLLGLEAGLYYNAFQNNGGYSSTGYSNSLNAKIGWGLAL